MNSKNDANETRRQQRADPIGPTNETRRWGSTLRAQSPLEVLFRAAYEAVCEGGCRVGKVHRSHQHFSRALSFASAKMTLPIGKNIPL